VLWLCLGVYVLSAVSPLPTSIPTFRMHTYSLRDVTIMHTLHAYYCDFGLEAPRAQKVLRGEAPRK
jgi:hypothetical protein